MNDYNSIKIPFLQENTIYKKKHIESNKFTNLNDKITFSFINLIIFHYNLNSITY